jgi:hypothetical protein
MGPKGATVDVVGGVEEIPAHAPVRWIGRIIAGRLHSPTSRSADVTGERLIWENATPSTVATTGINSV